MTEMAFRDWIRQLRKSAAGFTSESRWAEDASLSTDRRTGMDGRMADVSESQRDEALREEIQGLMLAHPLAFAATAEEKHLAVETVFNAMRRMDVLEPLLRDPETTEIMVNGPEQVFVERHGRLEQTAVRFDSADRLMELIQHLAARVNRNVNESEPIVDARLQDGSRLNAVLPPVALDGPLLTIRRFPEKPLGIAELIASGSLTEEAADYLNVLVKARYNLFICGGTGSGKTTFLNVLSGFIPDTERIVTLEDSAELKLAGIRNLARLETRTANMEGRGEITMQQLIRTSLRMRPDRIIVGEVRGAEAFDMLQAMNTGHDGSMSTGHANSPADMLYRLETMVSMAAAIPLDAIRRQIASAVDIIIFLQRLRDHSRRVVEIAEVTTCGADGIVLVPLFRFQEDAKGNRACNQACGREHVMITGSLRRTGNPIARVEKLRMRGYVLPIPTDVVETDGHAPDSGVGMRGVTRDVQTAALRMPEV